MTRNNSDISNLEICMALIYSAFIILAAVILSYL